MRSFLTFLVVVFSAISVVSGNEILPTLAGPVIPTRGDESPAPPVSESSPEFFVDFAGTDGPPVHGILEVEISPLERISRECRTGSLLFSRGDCLAIRIYTGSGLTHVATVVECDGEIWVYDSMNGVGVRKLLLQEYLAIQRPDELHLFHPARDFTLEETRAYRAALESKLGRPYSAKHFLTGRRNRGLHCSEYVTDALIEINWLQAENPVKVSPASLVAGILVDHVYTVGSTIAVPQSLEPIPEPQSWCGELWQDTKICTTNCCRQMSRMFLCQ